MGFPVLSQLSTKRPAVSVRVNNTLAISLWLSDTPP